MPVITSSNKLRTYTSARYYTDDEILEQITAPADNDGKDIKARAGNAAKKAALLPVRLVEKKLKQPRSSSNPMFRRKGGK